MKRTISWIIITCLIITSLVLASCSQSATSNTTIPTTKTSTTSITLTSSTTSKTTTSPTTNSTTQTTVTATTTAAGHWWDSLGTPQYGGTMTLRMSLNITGWDLYYGITQNLINTLYQEQLVADDWTLNPSIFSYQAGFTPSDYVVGFLAKDWEFSDPSTFVVHLRHDVYWQNIPPVNGRQFTSADVTWAYNRLFALGDGFTQPDPYYVSVAAWHSLTSITAPDKFTVIFKWSVANPSFIAGTMQAPGANQCFEPPEAVKQWGDLNDWHHAIGTGPFILTDFVDSSSVTFVKNPNYWGYDERYPQNKLPYVDGIKFLIIPNKDTALAAMRSGKIDVMDGNSIITSQAMKTTNPEITQIGVPMGSTPSVAPRNDVKPFNDIRVRIAMQEAIDLPTIAKTYYAGSCDPSPSTLTANYMTGWGFPYSQWPQSLKDEYAYNPTNARALLAAAGYQNGFNTDLVVDAAADQDLYLIVQSYFAAVGIKMEIRPMDTPSFTNFVVSSKKQDQIAARNQGELGLNFDPYRQLMRFQTGYSVNFEMVSDPVFDAYYPAALATTSIDAFKQVMKDTNQHVAQQHYVISLLQPNTFSFIQPWFKGYNAQSQAFFLLAFQFTSRFWIDQSVKAQY